MWFKIARNCYDSYNILYFYDNEYNNQTEKIYKTNILILEKSPNFEDRGGERSPPLFNNL